MSEMIFEMLQEEHLQEVLKIYNHYVIHDTATWHIEALTIDELKDMLFFEDKKYKTFVMITHNHICGYVLISAFKKREAWGNTAEVSIYLKHDHTGQGLGKLALAYIEKYAKQQNIHVLIASISGDNNSSLKLFEKCGYEKCAHYREVGYKFGQWLDAIAYQKILR